ncbi:LicD family protein [Ligilactobacillus sp. LYQ135]
MRFNNVQDATPEQIRALQLKELEILKKLKKVCYKHHLRFFLIGGTLIGALRNKGFVPWDDDVDVMMLREDFETLSAHSEWFSELGLVMQRSNEKINQHLTGIELKDPNTTFINKHSVNEDIQHSIAIDILPLDYRPIGKIKQTKQIIYSMLYSLYNADRVPDHQGTFLKIPSYILLKAVPSKKAKYKVWSWAQKKMVALDDKESREVVELSCGFKALFRYVNASWFESSLEVKFEDELFPIPIGYDEYLTAVFGDYMKLPPKEDQVAKHNTLLVDTEIPYEKSMREQFFEG